MKKLIALIGALATSFGLFAETTSYNISFEGADSSKGVDISAMTFTPDGEQWQWTGDAPLDLGAYADEGAGYAYGAGAFARRSDAFDAKSSNDYFLKLETGKSVLTCATDGNVFVDQVVKFTGFEEAPELAADQKMAVWASEFPVADSEDDETTTNLWVSCGKVVDGVTTQIDLPLNVANFQLDKWYRLTAKMIGNVYADDKPVNARAGFIVYIDGVQVGSTAEDAKTLTDKEAFLTPAASGLMAEGKLFLSYTEDATFSTVNYQGIGAIDDLIIDQDGPQFAQMANVAAADLAITGAVLGDVYQNGKKIDPVGGFYAVSPSDDIVAYYAAAAGKILKYDVDPTATWTADKDGNVEPKGAPDFTVVDAVAQIGDEPFEDLASTLARVQQLEQTTDNPITVNILKEIESEEIANVGSFGFSEGATIVIAKGGNWTVTGNALFVAEIGEGKTVEVNNGTLTFVGTVKAGAAVTAETMANNVGEIEIVLEPTATVTTKTDLSAVISATEGEIEPIPGEDDWKTYQVKSDAPVSTVTFTVDADAGIASFTASTNGTELADVEGVFTVEQGATVTVTPVAKAGYSAEPVIETINEDETVITLTSTVTDPVAMIGTKGYATLQDAFAAINASEGGVTLTMLKDIKIGHDELPVTYITKDFTWDLNDKDVEINALNQYQLNIQGCECEVVGGPNGLGVLRHPDYQSPLLLVIDGGKLTLTSGTIENTATNYESANVRVEGNSTFIMNGGTLKSAAGLKTRTSRGTALLCWDGGSTTINGGTVIGTITDYGWVSESAGTITIPATSTAKFEFDWTAFCATGYMTDDSQDGTATPYFVGAKIAITYVYGEGTAPATSNKAAFAAYTAARTFTLTQPTAPSGKVFDAWTTDATGVTFDGDAMTIAAEFGTAFTVTATYKADGPVYPPEWPDAPAYAEKFAAWSAAYDLTGVDLTTDAAKNAFLMNVDPKGTVPTLTIDSIDVDNAEQTATIVVSAGEKNLDEINGVLYVDVTDELGGEWATSAFDLATEIDKTTGKATFEVSTAEGQFMKAKVGFTTPTVE